MGGVRTEILSWLLVVCLVSIEETNRSDIIRLQNNNTEKHNNQLVQYTQYCNSTIASIQYTYTDYCNRLKVPILLVIVTISCLHTASGNSP